MLFAIIDLGTNGFRLQIAEPIGDNRFRMVYRESIDLKLAADGIARIGEVPFGKGIDILVHFSGVLSKYDITCLSAFGTAALRIADNGALFIETVKDKTGIDIELISGEREAELIFKGMREAMPVFEEKVLMMDVGGGSVEFIIAGKNRMFWAQSFDVGVAILKEKFHRCDPIDALEVLQIIDFLSETLQPLMEEIKGHPNLKIMCASGTTDVFVQLLQGNQGSKPLYYPISSGQFEGFHERFIGMTEQELKDVPGIPYEKVEMLAVSLVLMDFVNGLVGNNFDVFFGAFDETWDVD
jgi:exopolyphosphatase / guanosine-5'-triphosphate,3'-diphosphate pyrophosphatase